MQKLLTALAILLSAAFSACGLAAPAHTFTESKADAAELRYIGDIPVAIFTGTPDEIGRQHAQLVGEVSGPVLDFPKKAAAVLGVEALWPFMAQAGRTLMLNTPKRHQHELIAIAAGGDMPEDRIVVANTMLELRRMGCSSMIVEPSRSATGGPLFGRNFDFPTLDVLDKYSILMVYRPNGRRPFASVGFPGLVGVFTGINDAGLAVAALDVEQSADKSRKFNPKGTPLAFVFRRILEECSTVDEAEQLLKSEKPTTWLNLAVCDREGGAAFEITPDTIARREDEEGIVRCTNHFRTKKLSVGEQCDRYEALGKLAGDSAPLDVAAVHDRLHAANQERLTFQTMVFEPRELVLHLALGEPPSSDDPLTRIELAPLFKATVSP